jgi:hypothetical protein
MVDTIRISIRFWLKVHQYLKTLSNLTNESINDIVNGILCEKFGLEYDEELKKIIDDLPLSKAKKIIAIKES